MQEFFLDLDAMEMREFEREREFWMREFERKRLDCEEMRERGREYLQREKMEVGELEECEEMRKMKRNKKKKKRNGW